MGDPVVQGTGGRVVFLGRPIEAQAAAFAGERGDRSINLPPMPAAGGGVDKQILQVADLARGPGMGMEQIMGDPDQRSVGAAEPGAEAADRALRGDQSLPSVFIDLSARLVS